MDSVDCVVVGAGVVGLGIALKIVEQSYSCIVVDRMPSFGQGISSRNSEVIHAGLYHPPNSLKTKLCVRGKHLLYEYCKKRKIPHSRCGKLIVATSHDETGRLESIMNAAADNGVYDLLSLTGAQLKKIEPLVEAEEAIFSPSSGIIDSHSFMTSLVREIEDLDGIVTGNTTIEKVVPESPGFRVEMKINNEEYVLRSRCVVNSAGLGAQAVAERIEGFPAIHIPGLYLCKGSYFGMPGRSPFKHLIYPIPPVRGDGLGIHATVDLASGVKFGPDVEYVSDEDYFLDENKIDKFYQAISQYFPSIKRRDLIGAYAGIRPKLQGPNDGFKDFCISDCSRVGDQFSGLFQLFGIESPGLTSSLAIAEHIEPMIRQNIMD